MLERDFGSIREIKLRTPQERISDYSHDMADFYELDAATTDHLRSYGNIMYRVRQIRKDFSTDYLPSKRYSVSTHEKANMVLEIGREEFRQVARTLGDMGNTIYFDFLESNEKTQMAAHMMRIFVKDVIPNPKY